ncbi:hypothetical protein DRQ09_06075 [candidate division KSB1 bacterium]|nr:MAG: hypothetical protein DRQ09_06075 [candidate division KSB1 bacterium]
MLIDDINRILIIQLRQIGDVLLTTPFVKVLKENKKDCHITFLTEEAPAQVLYNNPYIDRIILFKKEKNPLRDIKFFTSLRKHKFDFVVDLLGTPGTALASILCGAKYRAGYALRGRKYAYNLKVMFNQHLKYNALRKLEILELIGIKEKTHRLLLNLTDEDRKKALQFFNYKGINDRDFVVSISPTSRRQARRWTKNGFAELSNLLVKKYKAKVIFLWGPGEYDYVMEIVNVVDSNVFVIPETNIREMAGFIEKSHLLICNDNGQKHIATALDIPTITIFGPTSDVVWNPPDREKFRVVKSNVECIECNKKECKSKICMKLITPHHIEMEMLKIKEIERFIRK